MNQITRRSFLGSVAAAAPLLSAAPLVCSPGAYAAASKSKMRLGLVTYNWGRNWDLPTILKNCQTTGFEGVELRSTHKHGVEPDIGKSRRKEVARAFADSPVEIVGLGSACEYHSPDPAVVKKNIEETKQFILLCHDIGGSGVKVRPNGLPQGVPVKKTLEQIGRSLNEVARFGADYGVAIRLEVHGRGTHALPHIKTIMDAAEHKNAVVCWNCNPADMDGDGLEANFNLVKDRIGVIHIHDLRSKSYPWAELFRLLKQNDFDGWTLLEEGKVPDDVVAAMKENRQIWERLVQTG